MKYLFLILFPMAFLYCNFNGNNKKLVNKEKNKFAGIWKEVLQQRIKGDPKTDSDYEKQFNNPKEHLVKNSYETYFIIRQKDPGLEITREVTDQDAPDKCDSIIINGDKLSFRKINQNNTYNYFTLTLKDKNILSGEMISYNGNTYKVEYERMPAGFKIKHTERSY